MFLNEFADGLAPHDMSGSAEFASLLESAADLGARADRLIAEARATEGDVIIFGHGHMLRVIGARWVDLPPEDGGLLGLGTGSLCTLGYEHDLPILVHWNEPGG